MSQPLTLPQAVQLALSHHEAGRLQQAESLYRQILQIQPQHPDALHLLGVIAHQANNNEAAVELIQKAIAVNPRKPGYHSNLGEAYRALGDPQNAMIAYRKAIELKPEFAEAWSNLGNVLGELKRSDEAVEACRKAIALKPTLAQAYNNLGNALEEKRQFADAIAQYKKALELDPHFAKAWSNLGISSHQRGLVKEAALAYEKALQADPNFADAHWNRSLALLLTGDFAQGWEEYEWRWKSKDFPSPVRNFPQPLFHRQDPAGKTILLHSEQGFGDGIQFARYVPLLAARGAKVIVECQPELRRLFQSLEDVTSLHDRGTPLPPFDLHAPFLSLPRAFATNATNIPHQVPYLKALPEETARWKSYLHEKGAGFTIGLGWAGRPTHREDSVRSIKLTSFAPLFQIPNVRFVSLQLGPAQAQVAPSGLPILDPTAQLKDFADSAALVSALDLVISVDTAIVHLAGSLAIPVWNMIQWVPDWRWLENRSDTPWYPTMRLFRQPALHDWLTVIDHLAAALREKVAPPPP